MAKIRLADLRLSLAPGEKKRISEGNGLTLILTGSEKGTSYKFQHRCTYAGKRREKILKTQELADARRISLERMELVEKGLDPDAVYSVGGEFECRGRTLMQNGYTFPQLTGDYPAQQLDIIRI